MNTQNDIIEKTKIRRVYLSDLHHIQSLYTEKYTNVSDTNTTPQNSRLLLTEDFGLTIALAEYNKEVIGYAAVVMHAGKQTQIQLYFKQGYELTAIEILLNDYAWKVLSSLNESNPNAGFKLENGIGKIASWLNKCQ